MKKNFVIFSLLTTLLWGCTPASSTGKHILDGTYVASAQGYRSEIKVETTIQNRQLSEVKILEQNETSILTDQAFKKLPKQMIEKQSLDVDLATGATTTSKAIVEAVKQTIQQANGSLNEWIDPQYESKKEEVEEVEVDAVVIGGGVAGTAATLRLRQLKVETAVFEKNPVFAASLGFEDNQDQQLFPAAHLSETLQSKLFDTYLEDTVQWQMKDLGIPFMDDQLFISQYNQTAGSIMDLLNKEVEVSGAKIFLNTMVYAYSYDETGKINGVYAKQKDGKVIHAQAKHVVIAAGGYGDHLQPIEELGYGGLKSNQGDLIGLSQDVMQINSNKKPMVKYTGYQFGQQAYDVQQIVSKLKNLGALVIDKQGKVLDLDKLNLSLQQSSQAGYILLNHSAYTSFTNAFFKQYPQNDAMKTSLLSHDGFAKYNGSLQELSEQLGFDQQMIKAYVKEQKDVLAFQTFQPDLPVYLIPIGKYYYDSLGGFVIDESFHPLDANGNPYEQIYVIGNGVGNVISDTSTGIHNAFAFLSAKAVGDMIGGTK